MKALLFCTLFFVWVAGARAENQWGYTCKSLGDCLAYIQRPPACADDTEACRDSWYSDSVISGLSEEFARFGRPAVSKLLDLMVEGPAYLRFRAAEVLHGSKFLEQADSKKVFAAWRRGGNWNAMMASSMATPEFVAEVIAELRRNPDEDGLAGQTFSNFREFNQPGITAVVTANIECAQGEPCNPGYARIQYKWLDGNVLDVSKIAPQLVEAIRNPENSVEAKIYAISNFRFSEYGRPRHVAEPIALPILREVLSDPSPELRAEAALLLSTYDDEGGLDVLLTASRGGEISNRLRAISALSSQPRFASQHGEDFVALLKDQDWNVRRSAAWLLGMIRFEDATPALIAAIDNNDWLASFSSVVALRTIGGKRADEALARIGKTYWHPAVREAAAGLMGEFGKYRGRAASLDVEDWALRARCKSRFERDGYRFVPDFIYAPEVLIEMEQASSHNWKHYTNSLLSRQGMRGAKPGQLEMQYLGWTFHGVDDERGIGGLTASKGKTAKQVVTPANVKAVFEWRGQPHVITEFVNVDRNGTSSSEGWLEHRTFT